MRFFPYCVIAGLKIDKFLEPPQVSAHLYNPFRKIKKPMLLLTKDLLTGKILKQLYPANNIRISGFEEIPEKEQSSYDVVASNILFGDTSVFDLSYSRSRNPAKGNKLPEAFITISFERKWYVPRSGFAGFLITPHRGFWTARIMSRYAGH